LLMAGSLAGSCRWQPSRRNEKIQQMQLAIPVHERPERNALTVGLSCESHGNMRPLSQRILSVLLFIPSSTALEARSR
jgi:hypothetical protein